MTTLWRMLFSVNVVLALLLGFSYPYQAPGSPARVISLLAFAIIGMSLVGLSVVMWYDWDPF